MSLEASITALTQQAGLLMDLPQQVNATAQAQIAAIGAAYQARLETLVTSFHVDQVVGLDTNAGTVEAPLRSITKALELTPRGGRCTVFLKTDYTISGYSLVIDGKSLVIGSGIGGKPNLYFERYVSAGGVYRGTRSFQISSGGHVTLQNLTINVPLLDANFSGQVLYNEGLFNASSDWAPVAVTIALCAVVIPATPFCRLFADTAHTYDLTWYGNTLPGAITSILGQVSSAQTNTAGVAAAGLAWIRTNLSMI